MKKHVCDLKEFQNAATPFHPLPPNASRWARLRRKLQIYNIADLGNVTGREFFGSLSAMRVERRRHVKYYSPNTMHPFSKASRIVEWLFFTTWLIQIYYVPVHVGLYVNFKYELVSIPTYLLGALQLIVIICFFFRGYIKFKTNEIILSRRSICLRYLRVYLVPDIVSAIGPAIHLELYDFLHEHFYFDTAFDLAIMISYYIRIPTIFRFFNRFMARSTQNKVVIFVVYHTLTATMGLHIMNCLVIAIPTRIYHGKFPKGSWFSEAGLANLFKEGFMPVYMRALHVTVCYFFGLADPGYKTEMPNEHFIFFVLSFVGRLYTLYMIADVLKLFGLVNLSESLYERQKTQLSEYMREKKLPQSIRSRMFRYFEFTQQREAFEEQRLIHTLSDQLQGEILLWSSKKLLDKIPVLYTVPPDVLTAFLAKMSRRSYLPNERVAKIGDPVEKVYFILSGSVALIDERQIEVCHLKDGDVFGLLNVVIPDYGSHRFEYIVIECSEIYSINWLQFKWFILSYEEVFKFFENMVLQKLKLFGMAKMYGRTGQRAGVLSELRASKVLEKREKLQSGFI